MSVFPRTNISIGKTYEYEYISEICQMLGCHRICSLNLSSFWLAIKQ